MFGRSPMSPGTRPATPIISDGYINSRIAKVDKNGNWLKSWGEPGDKPGQFNTPHSIAADAQGQCLRGGSRQSPHPGVRRRRHSSPPDHDRRTRSIAGTRIRRSGTSPVELAGARHARRAVGNLHHAWRRSGAVRLRRLSRPHLQAQPRWRRFLACSANPESSSSSSAGSTKSRVRRKMNSTWANC